MAKLAGKARAAGGGQSAARSPAIVSQTVSSALVAVTPPTDPGQGEGSLVSQVESSKSSLARRRLGRRDSDEQACHRNKNLEKGLAGFGHFVLSGGFLGSYSSALPYKLLQLPRSGALDVLLCIPASKVALGFLGPGLQKPDP